MTQYHLRAPAPSDGTAVNQLIGRCPPLDTNSVYCNLLQCTHFSQTSVIAEFENEPVGFISGYLIPDRPNTLFIWQVAVSKSARGQGLASRMLEHLLEHNKHHHIQFIETTITEDNTASRTLFKRFAKQCKSPLETETLFDKTTHFNGQHESEILVKIGPITSLAVAQ